MRDPLGLRRRVLPRWRDPQTTARLGELTVEKSETSPSLDTTSLFKAEQRWESARKNTQPQIPLELTAAEFVGEAIACGLPERAHEAASFLMADAPLPALLPLLSRVYTNAQVAGQQSLQVAPDASQESLIRGVRECRVRLRINQRDPIAWSELARLHTILGVPDKAEREMRTALSLSGGNRYLLRSGARYFVHTGELDRAHDLLRQAANVKSDPWLLASEIALASASGKGSKLLRIAKRVLADESAQRPFATSELASAVATEELASGGDRRTRQLFRRVLVDPHENALAQVQWARQRGLVLEPDERPGVVEHSYEARSRQAYAASNWQLCVDESEKWLADQPFSSQPAILGSYLCITVLDAHEQAASFCQRALFANPEDATLLNNLAVAQIGMGQLEDAARTLVRARVTSGTPEWVARTASRGMLAYRLGQHEIGRELYREAISAAEELRDVRLVALANAFAAREETLAGGDQSWAFLRAAEAHARSLRDPAVHSLLDRVANSRSAKPVGPDPV